mgnify:FL=1
MGFAVLDVDDQCAFLGICMQFNAETYGEGLQFPISHGEFGIEGDVAEAVAQFVASGLLHPVCQQKVPALKNADLFIFGTAQHVQGDRFMAAGSFDAYFIDNHGEAPAVPGLQTADGEVVEDRVDPLDDVLDGCQGFITLHGIAAVGAMGQLVEVVANTRQLVA